MSPPPPPLCSASSLALCGADWFRIYWFWISHTSGWTTGWQSIIHPSSKGLCGSVSFLYRKSERAPNLPALYEMQSFSFFNFLLWRQTTAWEFYWRVVGTKTKVKRRWNWVWRIFIDTTDIEGPKVLAKCICCDIDGVVISSNNNNLAYIITSFVLSILSE